jgi:hypothetical protein
LPDGAIAIFESLLGVRLGGRFLLLLGDQADVLEARVLRHPHDLLDFTVREPLVGLDDELARGRALVELVECLLELLGREPLRVDEVLRGVLPFDRDEPLLGAFRLLVRVVRRRELDVHALLEHGSDDHEDDEKNEADVHQRGDVDVALKTSAASAASHSHLRDPPPAA